MAFLAASRIANGVSKSGSPTPNAKTRCPASRSFAARAAIAKVALGATAERREASRVVKAPRTLAHPSESRYPRPTYDRAFFDPRKHHRSAPKFRNRSEPFPTYGRNI